jgi:hypothetical protein
MTERPAANGALVETTGPMDADVSGPEWSQKLIVLGQRVGALPIYASADWFALPPVDPRKFGSTVRAAECWRVDGTDDAIRRRLLDELRFADEFAAWRLRMMSWDLAEAEDWSEMAGSIDRSRRVRAVRDAGYRQPQRTPAPWPAASLDPANWRDDPNPSPNVPPGLRFRRHDAVFAARRGMAS